MSQQWKLVDDNPQPTFEQRKRHAQAAAFRDYVLAYSPRVGAATGAIFAGIMLVALTFAAIGGIISIAPWQVLALISGAFFSGWGIGAGGAYVTSMARYQYLLLQQGETREYAPPQPQPIPGERTVPFNGRPVIVATPDKVVIWKGEEVTVKGEQLLLMRDAVQDGDVIVTRDKFGIAGNAYGRLQAAMVGRGYWRDMGQGRGYQWTQDGVNWLYSAN